MDNQPVHILQERQLQMHQRRTARPVLLCIFQEGRQGNTQIPSGEEDGYDIRAGECVQGIQPASCTDKQDKQRDRYSFEAAPA